MEVISELNCAIIAPFFIIQLILMIVAVVDWTRIEKTNGPKSLWLIIILLGSMIGPILYFVIGRREY